MSQGTGGLVVRGQFATSPSNDWESAAQLALEAEVAIDAGLLERAGHYVDRGLQMLGNPQREDDYRALLDLKLREGSVAHYRGARAESIVLASEAKKLALEQFGEGSVQDGRARLRVIGNIESEQRYLDARTASVDLCNDLAFVPGGDGVRLNALRAALACAVKNTDRHVIGPVLLAAEPILNRMLTSGRPPKTFRWFLYWLALAKLAQGQTSEFSNLLNFADQPIFGPPSWRWQHALDVARQRKRLLDSSDETSAMNRLDSLLGDARTRGYFGLIASIDHAFRGVR